jgi:hypothetical protein
MKISQMLWFKNLLDWEMSFIHRNISFLRHIGIEQVNAIDNAIWMIIDEENKQAELIETIEKLEKQLVELKNKLN